MRLGAENLHSKKTEKQSNDRQLRILWKEAPVCRLRKAKDSLFRGVLCRRAVGGCRTFGTLRSQLFVFVLSAATTTDRAPG